MLLSQSRCMEAGDGRQSLGHTASDCRRMDPGRSGDYNTRALLIGTDVLLSSMGHEILR